ncbi:hypothetical protein Bcell_2838 [Evansella cellulosilytica DSM 2522]|uniref:Uncharacterized protein n=2 Tax=Evansella TaxID=2837485 RepID=E6TWD5_EVAC2|nr:hypothetical protein Bcell_2838 [Evansella cellulosilytica DSM 2522]
MHSHYKKASKAYFILSFLQFIGALILLYLVITIDNVEISIQLIYPMIFLFGGSIALLITAIVKQKRSHRKYNTPNISRREEDLFQANRLMLVPHVHWLREYEYYALNGKSVARIREEVEGWKRVVTFFLHLIKLRPYLKKSIIVENGEKVLFYLKKDWGFRQRYRVYNENKELIASYKMNLFNPISQYATIYDENGNIIGKNDGGFSAIQFKIKNNNEEKLIELKYQGVPLEAMELFSGTNGDIVDFNRDVLTDEEMQKFVLAPVIVQLHFR